MPDILGEVNDRCATDFDEPDHERYGYRFWFRGYIPSPDDTSLIGIALAWPPEHQKGGPYYYSIAGGEGIGEYKAGDAFPITNKRNWADEIRNHNVQAFVDEKNRAMGLLLDYVRLAKQLTAAHS
jgi:hypothetical protein